MKSLTTTLAAHVAVHGWIIPGDPHPATASINRERERNTGTEDRVQRETRSVPVAKKPNVGVVNMEIREPLPTASMLMSGVSWVSSRVPLAPGESTSEVDPLYYAPPKEGVVG